MSKLPLLEKNAYLKILIDSSGIYSHLVYSDYSNEKFYVLTDYTKPEDLNHPLPKDSEVEFLEEYLSELAEKFEWEFFIDTDTYFLKDVVAEGIGLGGVTIYIDTKTVQYRKNLATDIRTSFGDFKFQVLDQDYIESLLKLFASKFGYKDVFWIDVDVDGLAVNRLQAYEKNDNLNLGYRYDPYLEEDLNEAELLDLIRNKEILSFIKESGNISKYVNDWANYVLGNTIFIYSELMKDFLRGATTLRLFSHFNEKQGEMRKFGVNKVLLDQKEGAKSECAVIITGIASNILDFNELLIAVIDGIQLSGHFDLFMDKEKKLFTYGNSYLYGVNSEDIILNKQIVLDDVHKIIIPDLPKMRGGGKSVMTGRVYNVEKGELEIYGVMPRFKQFNVRDINQHKTYLDVNFVKGAKLKDFGKKVEFFLDPSVLNYSSVIFDLRDKPVSYGPDAGANNMKWSRWFNE